MKYKVNQQLVAINNSQIRIYDLASCSFLNFKLKSGFGYKVIAVYESSNILEPSIILKIGEDNLLLGEKEANREFVIYKGCHK